MIWKRSISCSRISIASFGLSRWSTFSRRSGSIAASSRTSLSRVFRFAYALQPIPIASSPEIVQTVTSVPVIIANYSHLPCTYTLTFTCTPPGRQTKARTQLLVPLRLRFAAGALTLPPIGDEDADKLQTLNNLLETAVGIRG